MIKHSIKLVSGYKFKSFVILLLLSCSGFCQQNIKTIEDLINSDPEQGLLQAKQFWQGKEISPENSKAGLLLVSAYMKNKQYDAAKDLLDQFLLLDSLEADQKGLLLARKLNYIRNSKSTEDFTNTYQEVDALITELIQKVELEDRNLALYQLNEEMGFKHYYAAEFEAAEPYFIRQLEYIDKSKKLSLSHLMNTLGVVYAQQAKLAIAAQYMLDSIKLREDNDLPVSDGQYQNLGSLYFGLKEYDKTIEYSQKALDLQTEPLKSTVALYSNMAAAQIEKGILDKAVDNLHKSIDIGNQLGISTASARNNLGYVYNQMGEYEKALEQLNLSAQELDDSDNSELRGVSFKSRADVYAAMKNYDQAIDFYEQAYQAFTNKDLKLKRVELYPKMLEVLEIKKDYPRAYQILQEYKTLNDELTGIESTKQVNEILSKFEFEKKEQELVNSELVREQQRKDIAILNKENNFEYKIRNLMFVLLVVLVVMLLLTYRSRRFRGKVNQVLLDKNNRIENQHNELAILNSKLKKQTEIDTLTGLKNRRFVTHMIAKESAKEQKDQRKWCLIIIDLDDFKNINDKYGHQRGDEVLIQFSRCLKQTKSKRDVVARWGGEEFLWLSEITAHNNGPKQCDKFQSNLSNQSWFEDEDISVTCSIGFSSFPLIELNFKDWEAALRLADYALYQAKNSGKDCWTGFEIIDPKLDYDEIKDIELMVKGKRLRVLKK